MRVLIAGIGNVFMGDDGFGCEVVRRLGAGPLPQGVDAIDFGTGGMDLGYALTEGYDAAILVDTLAGNEAPGSVSVIEPEVCGAAEIVPHDMDPVRVLRFAATLGKLPPRLRLVGCEPASLGGEAGHLGLSVAAAAAVECAVQEIRRLLAEWCGIDSPVAVLPAVDKGVRALRSLT
jgi:hydrogenase maturation protease